MSNYLRSGLAPVWQREGLRGRGLVQSASEVSPSFAVAEGNRHRGTRHAVQEDRGPCGVVEDFHHAEACAHVPLEVGSCLCARDEGLETAKELTSIAHVEGESIFPHKEVSKSPSDVLTKQDRLCPALAGA